MKRPHDDEDVGAKRAKEAEAVTVDSRNVLSDVKQFARKTVGSVEYAPRKLLAAGRELDLNCELQVRIGAAYIRRTGDLVSQRPLWGTDVYTDDSDLLAVLKHLGYQFSAQRDVSVRLLLLPPLKRYTGCVRNSIGSRNWTTRHDGISYMVLGEPREMPLGWAGGARSQQPERLLLLKELRQPYKSPLI